MTSSRRRWAYFLSPGRQWGHSGMYEIVADYPSVAILGMRERRTLILSAPYSIKAVVHDRVHEAFR
jgi:hypothetical protein